MAKKPLTAQQEMFAQLVVIHGKRQRIAYRKAYPDSNMSDKTVDEAASRLMMNAAVAARVEQLRAMAAAKLDMTVQDIVHGLARIAQFDLRDCFDETGALLPPHELPEDVALSLDGIDVVEMAGSMKISVPAEKGKGGEGTAVSHVPMYTKKVRVHSKLKALELLGSYRKMFVEQHEHGQPGDFSRMSDEEFAEHHAALREAVKAIEVARKGPKVKVHKLTQG